MGILKLYSLKKRSLPEINRNAEFTVGKNCGASPETVLQVGPAVGKTHVN